MKRLVLAVVLWLLLAGAGVAALFVNVRGQFTETFDTDARILHRVLSQRMEQQEAVLNAMAALGQGMDAAALGRSLDTLLRPYPQVVAVESCSARGCQVLGTPAEPPPKLAAVLSPQPAVRWPKGGGPLYALSRGDMRVWVDARRLTGALDSGAAPLSYTLFQPNSDTVIVAHTPGTAHASAALRVEKVLGTALQPFPIRISRPVPWGLWPWQAGLLWTLLTAGLTALVWRLLEGRRAAQSALLDERARAGGVVEATSEAIVALDDLHRVTLANPAARAALAHPLPPGTDLRAVTTFRATLSQAPFDAASFWDSPGPANLPEGLTLIREGEAVQVEGSLAPLRGADGRLRGRVLILRAVGPLQRRMLEHLEDGERRVREHEDMLAHVSRLSTLGEMGAGLAHELNQPLTAIVSYGQAAARLLDDSEPDLARVRHAVMASVTQAGRAAQIILRLRQWVRRVPSSARPTDLVQAVQNVLTLCRADLNRLDVRVVTDYADAPLVQADPVQLEQIVLNLLRNALDALQHTPDPSITVSIVLDAEGWNLSVRDNGPGIAAGVVPRLFTPFTTSKEGGLGVWA